MVKWPKPGRKPNNQTNRPVEEHRYPEIKIYLAQGKVEAIPQIPPPPTDSPKTKSKSGDPTPPWKKHIEIAGFCVLVVYAAATVLMYFANKNSSEAARDAANAAQTSASIAASTMQIDQRPWIYVTGGTGSNPNPGPEVELNGGAGTIHMTATDPLFVNLTIANVGKTPAMDVTANFYVEVVENGFEPVFGSSGPHTRTQWGALIPNAHRILRVERKGLNIGKVVVAPLLQSEDDALVGGRSWIAIHGRIEYSDVFRKRHWTQFCSWAYKSTVVYTSKGCVLYNAVGDTD